MSNAKGTSKFASSVASQSPTTEKRKAARTGYRNSRPKRQLVRTYRQHVPEITKLAKALTARRIRSKGQRRKSSLTKSDQFNNRNSVLTCQFGALVSTCQTATTLFAAILTDENRTATCHVCINCRNPFW